MVQCFIVNDMHDDNRRVELHKPPARPSVAWNTHVCGLPLRGAYVMYNPFQLD